MTQISSADFKTVTTTLYPDNTSGDITPADLRIQMDNIADSLTFMVTGKLTPPGVTDDGVNSSGAGVFEVGHTWIDETSNESYMCIDNTGGAAIWLPLTTITGTKVASILDAQIGGSYWQVESLPLTGGSMTGDITMTVGNQINFQSPDGLSTANIVNDNSDILQITASGGLFLNGAGITINGVAQDSLLRVGGSMTGDIVMTAGTQIDFKSPNGVETATIVNNDSDELQITATGGLFLNGVEIVTGTSILAVAASRFLALTDGGNILEVNNTAGDINLTIQPDATVNFPIGTIINVTQLTVTNLTNIVGGAGVSLNGIPAGTAEFLPDAYAGVSLYKRAADSWVVQGKINPVV